jgi:phosphoesterase RecJ-like protein
VDLFLALDSSTTDRLGEAQDLFSQAGTTVCIDHHVSNLGYAEQNFVLPDASSTCEVLFGLLEEELIDEKIAEALYIGLIMDTGVFRYSCTSRKTMEIAGFLMEKGVPFWKYIDECFYQRTYTQTQLLGRTLLTSMRLMEGKVIVATVTRRSLDFYGAQTEDVEGIIDQLRLTKGVEVALLLQETDDQEYKVSMRSNSAVDVSKIAVYFGGGGHVKAAGCTMRGSVHDVVNNITEHIEFQM